MKIQFYRHAIEEEDIKNATIVLRSTFLGTGEYVLTFEHALEEYLKIKTAVGVMSCTAALHLSLFSQGIKKGDEIITTPLSYVATSTAIECTGAKPIFVDVEQDTGNIDIKNIEKAITKHTKIILPVHLYGLMVDMKSLRSLADQYALFIIEDAAHAIESIRDGIRPGQIGDIACFSFYPTKNITCGEGGAITTNDIELGKRLKRLRSHGVSKEISERYKMPQYEHYDLLELGWKYNMNNIQAALLLGQLQRMESRLKRREEIKKIYDEAFQEIHGIQLCNIPKNARSALHLYTIQVPRKKRDGILHFLEEHGVEIAVNYRPIHLMQYFKEKYGFKKGMFPNAENIGASTITIPFYPKLRDEEIEYSINIIRLAVKKFRV